MLGLGPSVSHPNFCLKHLKLFDFPAFSRKYYRSASVAILFSYESQTCIMTWNLRTPAAAYTIPPGSIIADQKPQSGRRLHCWVFPPRRHHPGDGHLQQPGEDVGVQGQQGQPHPQCPLQLVLSCCCWPCTPVSCMLQIMKAPTAGGYSHLCLPDAVGRMPSVKLAASIARCCILNRHPFLSARPLLKVVAFSCNSTSTFVYVPTGRMAPHPEWPSLVLAAGGGVI